MDLIERFNHTSASASAELYPIYFKVFANLARHAALINFKLYNHLAIIITDPFSLPNSTPAVVQILSLQLAFKYSFPIPHAKMSRSFRATLVKVNGTLSLDTTVEDLIFEDNLVL